MRVHAGQAGRSAAGESGQRRETREIVAPLLVCEIGAVGLFGRARAAARQRAARRGAAIDRSEALVERKTVAGAGLETLACARNSFRAIQSLRVGQSVHARVARIVEL